MAFVEHCHDSCIVGAHEKFVVECHGGKAYRGVLAITSWLHGILPEETYVGGGLL